MTKRRQLQVSVQQTGQLWATGKRGANVCISVETWPDGSFIATSDQAHITRLQFERALVRVYGHGVKAREGWGGYWRADGRAVEHGAALADR